MHTCNAALDAAHEDMRDLNWENFDDGPVRSTKERIHITLNGEGKIFFNKKAWEALGSPDGVALMYDRRQKLIGVRASLLNRRETYLLRRKQRKFSGWVINAANFCRRFGINPSETLAFSDAKVDNDSVLLLDLNEVHSVKKR